MQIGKPNMAVLGSDEIFDASSSELLRFERGAIYTLNTLRNQNYLLHQRPINKLQF